MERDSTHLDPLHVRDSQQPLNRIDDEIFSSPMSNALSPRGAMPDERPHSALAQGFRVSMERMEKAASATPKSDEHSSTVIHRTTSSITDVPSPSPLILPSPGGLAHLEVPTSPSQLPNAEGEDDAQSFAEYLSAEFNPGPSYSKVADTVWGQTERDRVYNALILVPYQLERLVWLGVSLCIDSFLAVFTVLPLRVIRACLATTAKIVSLGHTKNKLRGDQLFDLLCAALFMLTVVFLYHLKAGSIYYWVKDMTQEFLKLSVLMTALELCDKICCSFLVDVMEALAASCTTLASEPVKLFSSATAAVMCDATVALALLLAHGSSLMSQALVFGVAMNSQKHTLLALLIASNFTEIKGTVFKRFDATKLFVLTIQDVVERFHLFIVLSFVLVEEAGGTGSHAPSRRLLFQCGYVLFAEVVIDIVKHAVLGKFNDIRPGVYREFTKDLCEKIVTSQSHSVHRLVGFAPFASAALFVRVVLTYAVLRFEGAPSNVSSYSSWALSLHRATLIIGLFLCWLMLLFVKIALGYFIKRLASSYIRWYEAGLGHRLFLRSRDFNFLLSTTGLPASKRGSRLAKKNV